MHAEHFKPTLEHRQRVGDLMRNFAHVLVEALLQQGFARRNLVAMALGGVQGARRSTEQGGVAPAQFAVQRVFVIHADQGHHGLAVGGQRQAAQALVPQPASDLPIGNTAPELSVVKEDGACMGVAGTQRDHAVVVVDPQLQLVD